MSKNFTFSFLFTALFAGANAQQPVNIDNVLRYGNYDIAKEYYYQKLRVEPLNGQHYYDMGRIHINEKRNDSADIYFKKGLKAERNIDVNNLGISRISLDSGNEKEALSKLNTILSKSKNKDPKLFLDVAKIYLESSKPNTEKAIEYAKKAQKLAPKDFGAILVEADAYFLEGTNKLAEEKYKYVVKYDPKNIEARLKLAMLYRKQNVFDKSLELYNQALELNEDLPATHRDLANYYKDLANFSGNKAHLKKAVDHYKTFRTLLGRSFDIDNQYGDFVVSVEDYTALNNLVEEIWYSRGENFQVYRFAAVSAFEKGDFENAYTYSNQYFDVQDVETEKIGVDYFYLGLSQIAKSVSGKEVAESEFNTGIKNLEKGISLDSTLANRIYKKGLALFEKGHYKQAYYVFDLGTKNENVFEYVSNLYYKATSLYLTSDTPIVADPLAKAVESYDKAIAVSPQAHEVYLMNARANRNIGTDDSKAKMIKNYEGFLSALQAKRMLNNKEFKQAIVEAYTQIGDYYKDTDKVKAAASFENILKIDPTNEYSKSNLSVLK